MGHLMSNQVRELVGCLAQTQGLGRYSDMPCTGDGEKVRRHGGFRRGGSAVSMMGLVGEIQGGEILCLEESMTLHLQFCPSSASFASTSRVMVCPTRRTLGWPAGSTESLFCFWKLSNASCALVPMGFLEWKTILCRPDSGASSRK
jgi:hypothetical protein